MDALQEPKPCSRRGNEAEKSGRNRLILSPPRYLGGYIDTRPIHHQRVFVNMMCQNKPDRTSNGLSSLCSEWQNTIDCSFAAHPSRA